ncbi:hypothetical protein B566_EDAN006453 [Ephemera danica]|nr:hypothetical protein B566_EDAN006453 [Ephemera danica]
MALTPLSQRISRPGIAWLASCCCLAVLALASPTQQMQAPGAVGAAVQAVHAAAEPEDGPDLDKRAWSDLSSSWGKRGWQDLKQSGWGKRAWSDLGSSWGKRDWGSFRGAWGKRAWDDLRPMWGKRGWDNFHGSWGKRWPETDEMVADEAAPMDPDDLSDEQVATLAELMLLSHSEAPNTPPSTTAAMLAQLSDEEQKRSWSNLRGAWGKRGWSNFKARGGVAGSWGKKREPGWNNLKGLWGKRSANNWNKLASVWGKRSVDGDFGVKEDTSSTREN